MAARDWQALEYIDQGVSGARDRRPALHRLMVAVKARISPSSYARLVRLHEDGTHYRAGHPTISEPTTAWVAAAPAVPETSPTATP